MASILSAILAAACLCPSVITSAPCGAAESEFSIAAPSFVTPRIDLEAVSRQVYQRLLSTEVSVVLKARIMALVRAAGEEPDDFTIGAGVENATNRYRVHIA